MQNLHEDNTNYINQDNLFIHIFMQILLNAGY